MYYKHSIWIVPLAGRAVAERFGTPGCLVLIYLLILFKRIKLFPVNWNSKQIELRGLPGGKNTDINMQTHCLALVLSKSKTVKPISPWERHSKFLADEFRLEPRYTKWNEAFMVYQSSHNVYSTWSKHTGCLIALAEDISSCTYTTWPKSYCMALSEIYVNSMFIQGSLNLALHKIQDLVWR